MSIGRFLAGVSVLLMEADGPRYLILKRAAHRDFGAGLWESMTGRVEQGEGFEEAAHREVLEELGVSVTLRLLLGTIHFYRGAPVAENEMLGVVYAATVAGPAAPQIGDEHSEPRWVTAAEAEDLLHSAHPAEDWLLRVIRRAEQVRAHTPPELVDTFGQQGFEMDRL
jgi:8-oxo-dGTP pyrophosphatase MutT (NUDIX family)